MRRLTGTMVALFLLAGFVVSATAEPRHGGTFEWVASYGNSVATLDPHATNSEANLKVIIHMQRGLYGWDAANGTYRLELAESVEPADDGLTFTYKLRDAKFHNGRTVTADDVIYSFNRICSPDNPFGATADKLTRIKGVTEVVKGEAKTISGLKKIDDKTVSITFTEKLDPGFVLWRPNLAVVPKEEVEKGGFSSKPVGCGPFKFVEWVKGSKIVMERNPDYYKEGLPYLDKIVQNVMGDGAARDMAFMSKELDANILSSDQWAKYQKDPSVKDNLVVVAEQFTRAMRFNPNYTLPDGRKPLSDKRVRQAINYAIDTDLIVLKYAKGKGVAAKGFLCPTTPGADPNPKFYNYDLEKAKALMKEAGYEDGFEMEVIAQKGGSAGDGVIVAATPFLNKINIKVNIVVAENAVHYPNYMSGNFKSAAINSHSSGPDAIDVLSRFHSKNPKFIGRGETALKIDSFDRTLDLARKATDPEVKTELIRIANDILTEEAIFWFYNYNKAIIIYHPWVHGLQPVGVELAFQDFESIWVDDTSPRANDK